MAIAGFVCVIVGLIVPMVGLVGLVLSIVGYRRAKREGLPTGLALAGAIIGGIATVLGVVVLVLVLSVGLFTGGSASSSSEQASVSPSDYVGVWRSGQAPVEIKADGSDLVVTLGAGAWYSDWPSVNDVRFVPEGDHYRASEGSAALKRDGDSLDLGLVDDSGNLQVVTTLSPTE